MTHAWLDSNRRLYWSEYRRAHFEPRSAVTCLVEGIWRAFPDSAHFMLRSRIYTNAPLTEMCRGTILICAKRVTYVSGLPNDLRERMTSSAAAVRVWPYAGSLSATSVSGFPSASVLAVQNRSIECWLIGGDGRLLMNAVNSAGRNRTQHAEINLLKAWWARCGQPLPRRSKLVTTLEPCAMCAGAIWECVEERSEFEVCYLQAETGKSASRSILRGHPMLRQCPNVSHD